MLLRRALRIRSNSQSIPIIAVPRAAIRVRSRSVRSAGVTKKVMPRQSKPRTTAGRARHDGRARHVGDKRCLSADLDAPNTPAMPGVNALPHQIAAALVIIAVVIVIAGIVAEAEAEASPVVAVMLPATRAVLPISRSMLPVRRAAPLPARSGRASYASTGAWVRHSGPGRRHSRRVNAGASTEAAAAGYRTSRWRAAATYAAAARNKSAATTGVAFIASGGQGSAGGHGRDRGRRTENHDCFPQHRFLHCPKFDGN